MYLPYIFAGLLAAIQVSGSGLPENVDGLLHRRGPCDDTCAKSNALTVDCARNSDVSKCICTDANYVLVDACVVCMVTAAKDNGSSAEAIQAEGDKVKDQMIKTCAAAGYPLDAASGTVTTVGDSSPGMVTTMGDGTVTTMGDGISGSVTTQGATESKTSLTSATTGTVSTTSASAAAAATSSAGNGASRGSVVGGSVAVAVGFVFALL